MKRLLVPPAVIGLLTLAALPARAASPVTQETVAVQSVFGASVGDPCSGASIAWTGTVHLVGAMTTDAAGGAVFLAHVNFDGVQGTDPTGTRYTVVLTSNDTVVFAPSSPNLPSANVETHVIRLEIISHGSAPNASVDLVGHYTITPDGQVAVSFEKVDAGCSS
jgi:hypothetical protein